MGKSLLLIVGAAMLSTGTLILTSARDNLGMADRSLNRQATRVLAREAALSGIAEGEGQLLPVLAASGAYTGDRTIDGRYQGGTFRTTITNTGADYTVRTEGRFDRDTAYVSRAYRLESVGGSAWRPPVFMRSAAIVGGNLKTEHNFAVAAENALLNAHVHANGNVEPVAGLMRVAGFGSYGGNLAISNGQTAAQVFQPRVNPTALPIHARAPLIAIPDFIASNYRPRATRTTSGDLALSGTVALGTRAAPTVWYVDGNIRTTGDVAFTGYGVFITPGSVEVYHHVRSAPNPVTGESTLGIYTQGSLNVINGSLTVSGQWFAQGNIQTAANTTLVGSLTVRGNLQNQGPFGIVYRPASEGLTRPVWTGEEEVAPVARRTARLSSREWLSYQHSSAR